MKTFYFQTLNMVTGTSYRIPYLVSYLILRLFRPESQPIYTSSNKIVLIQLYSLAGPWHQYTAEQQQQAKGGGRGEAAGAGDPVVAEVCGAQAVVLGRVELD